MGPIRAAAGKAGNFNPGKEPVQMNFRSENAPNILFITADQLRWDFVHAYGVNPWIHTPNLDSLAEDGCLFERAYSPNPVCIPARHNILTGLTARYHGFDDNYFGPDAKPCPSNLPTFAQILSGCGYSTAAIGKIHFQPERNAAGFDLFENCDEVVSDIAEDEYAQFLRSSGHGSLGSIHGVRNALYMQPQQYPLPQEYHGSYWIAERAIRYIRSRVTRKRPFLLWAGFIHPHPPLAVPENWAHLYDGKVPPHTSPLTPLSKFAEENKCIADLPDEACVNRVRELYACAVSFMDYNVGRILRALDETGQRENTLVVFVSDHGEMLGDLDTYQKFLPYDASCRVPFLMRWPGHIQPGSRRKDFVDLNDLLPTFLDAAGASYTAEYPLPGESLLTSQGKKDRSVQYVEHQRENKRWCCLMDQRYKFVHHYGEPEELFDVEADPEERTNLLYGTPGDEVRKICDDLRAQLLEYEAQWGLPGYVEGGSFRRFPDYEIKTYQECCFPSAMVQDPGEAPRDSLLDEILRAIAKEPLVKLSKLHIRDLLTGLGGFSDAEVDDLLRRAQDQGN